MDRRAKRLLAKAESQIMAEFDQEYATWLQALSKEQHTYYLDAILSGLAREGLGPDLYGRSIGEMSEEEAYQAREQAMEMQARDPVRAGQVHSEAIRATVNRYQNWPGIERWLWIPELAQN